MKMMPKSKIILRYLLIMLIKVQTRMPKTTSMMKKIALHVVAMEMKNLAGSYLENRSARVHMRL